MPTPYDPEYYQLHDKPKHQEYYKKNKKRLSAQAHERYLKNREYYLAACKERRRKNAEYANDWLRAHPCVDCGENDIDVLQFDHVRGKYAGISQLIQAQVSTQRLQEEIDKCDVRCANCHLRETKRRRLAGLPPAILPTEDTYWNRLYKVGQKRTRERNRQKYENNRAKNTNRR